MTSIARGGANEAVPGQELVPAIEASERRPDDDMETLRIAYEGAVLAHRDAVQDTFDVLCEPGPTRTAYLSRPMYDDDDDYYGRHDRISNWRIGVRDDGNGEQQLYVTALVGFVAAIGPQPDVPLVSPARFDGSKLDARRPLALRGLRRLDFKLHRNDDAKDRRDIYKGPDGPAEVVFADGSYWFDPGQPEERGLARFPYRDFSDLTAEARREVRELIEASGEKDKRAAMVLMHMMLPGQVLKRLDALHGLIEDAKAFHYDIISGTFPMGVADQDGDSWQFTHVFGPPHPTSVPRQLMFEPYPNKLREDSYTYIGYDID